MTRVLAPVAPTQSEPRRRVLVAQLAQPVRTYLANEAGSAGLLLGATLLALLWANSPLVGLVHLALAHGARGPPRRRARSPRTSGHWVDDGLMVLFFFVVGLEVRRELSMGELTDRRRLRRARCSPRSAASSSRRCIYLAINPTRRRGERLGRRHRHGHRVPARRAGARRPGVPHAAAGLPADAVDRRRRRWRSRVIGVVYSDSIDLVAVGGRGRCLVAHRAAQPPRRVADVGVRAWSASCCGSPRSSPACTRRSPAWSPACSSPPTRRAARRSSRPRRLFRAFRQSPLPSVGYSARLEPRARGVAQRAPADGAAPVDELRDRAAVRARQRGRRPARRACSPTRSRSPITWGVVLGLVVGKLVGIGVAVARRRAARARRAAARRRVRPGRSAARRSPASASRSRC